MTEALFDFGGGDLVDRVVEVHQDPEVADLKAELLPPDKRNAHEQSRLQQMEDDAYKNSLEVLAGVTAFADIPVGGLGQEVETPTGPPKEWVIEMGRAAAEKKYRLALMGNLSTREAPVGIKVAQQTVVGIMKAREGRGQVSTINVAVVQMPGKAVYELPERTVEK